MKQELNTLQTALLAFEEIRHRIYEIIEVGESDDDWGKSYDRIMIVTTVMSIFPLFFKETNEIFYSIEELSVKVFLMDYFLRWLTTDLKRPHRGARAFLTYPVTFFAMVDFLSVLPWLMKSTVSTFRVLRIFRACKAIRLLRYFTGFRIIGRAIQKERKALEAVLLMALMYILVSALVMFSAEPGNFRSFFDALYWAVVTLTTVGYGDVYPVTDFGRVVSMISSFVGIAIVALPTGIMTAGFMDELQHHYENEE